MKSFALCLVSSLLQAAEPPRNIVARMEPGEMPARVHVFEDYETEIEKRWWLRGAPVTEGLAESLSRSVPNLRASRAAETKDFDDKQGDPTRTWKAVIFNPVPGPPMGASTRLSFRYRLKGTDTLRVQIYSLSNGYHRHLSLVGLPQGEWRSAAVDMTQARRPDGTGGPLSADERIDDIQFYIPADADLLIDDIVLYEAALEGEKSPFPKRIIFTGWFDTGKQGTEWPGEFEIVKHDAPLIWKCAKSIVDSTSGESRIRVGLRGLRPLGEVSRLRFRCKASSDGQLKITLKNSASGQEWSATNDLKGGDTWTENTVDFSAGTRNAFADELRFAFPKGAVFFVDDVLFFEP